MMTKEVEESYEEKPATHRKNAQIYMLSLVAVISVALIISSIISSNTMKETKEEEARRKDQDQLQYIQGNGQFERKFQHENRKLLREKQLKDKKSETSLESIIANKDKKVEQAKLKFQKNQPNMPEKADPYEAWLKNEQVRVWDARRSPFKVNLNRDRKGTIKPNGSRSPYNHVSIETQTKGLSPLDKERALVNKQIQNLQNVVDKAKANGNEGALNPERFNYLKSIGAGQSNAIGSSNRFSSNPGGKIVVGQPFTEKQPAPGELLLPTATVIRAALESKSISDYTGSFKAQIMDDVYDVTGEFVLIPKGSKVDGQIIRITNVNEPIQNRLGMLTRWIILPNGKRISLVKASAQDAEGVGAIEGDVNRHLIAQFLGVAAYALVANESSRKGSSYFDETDYAGEVGQGFRDQMAPLAQKYLALVPTVTLHRGTPLRIYIEDDIYAKPWSKVVSGLLSAY